MYFGGLRVFLIVWFVNCCLALYGMYVKCIYNLFRYGMIHVCFHRCAIQLGTCDLKVSVYRRDVI